jgi:serine/threonine protein kinase
LRSNSNPFWNIIIRVKLAQCVKTLEWVAIKIMKDQCVNSVEKIDKFMSEVRLLAQSVNTNIVEIISVSLSVIYVDSWGNKRSVAYYCMKCAKYGELYKLIRATGSFQEKIARSIFVQLISGNNSFILFKIRN